MIAQLKSILGQKLWAMAALGLLVFAVSSGCSSNAGPLAIALAPEADDDRQAEEQRTKRLDRDERAISIRVANEFHRRFFEQCIDPLPQSVKFQYFGPLYTESSRLGQRVNGPAAGTLDWGAYEDVVIFTIRISTDREKETVAECTIEGQKIFINVVFVDQKQSIDKPLPSLGDRSVRQVVAAVADKPQSKP